MPFVARMLVAFAFAFAATGIAKQSAADPVEPQSTEPDRPVLGADLFPLSTVRLLNSPFKAAVTANREYLLALDPDRLLAPFRREA
jgi:hypothetical protein